LAPTPNVLLNASPDFLQRSVLLIKPSYPFLKCFPSGRRDTRYALFRNPVPEKRKSPLDPSDEGFIGVLLDVQLAERLVDDHNSPPQRPPRGSHDHPVIHEAGVGQTRGL
jgi:hypothetical protein